MISARRERITALVFERDTAEGREDVMFDVEKLILAGCSARDEASVRGHIEELGALGVPPPSAASGRHRASRWRSTTRQRGGRSGTPTT